MKRFVLPLALLLAVAGLPTLVTAPAAAAPPTTGQSVYVPVDPVRLLDTRTGTGGRLGPVGPGQTIDLIVADGVRVPTGASAVLLNVTATQGSSATDIRVYPTPSGTAAVPTVSNLNVPPGVTVAGLVTVKVGSSGRVRLRNASGVVSLVADLSGYTIASGSRSTYIPLSPVRLLDTRDTVPVGPGEVRLLDVRNRRGGGTSGVPAGATAVALNVTAVSPTQETDVRVYPTRAGGAVPTVSNLNARRGQTVPNLVVVAVGELSQVSLRNAAGATHLIADVAGWYAGNDAGAAFHPVDPVRLADTRAGGPVGPGGVLDVRIGGVGRVPGQATAVVLNVTAVGATGATDVRAYPTSGNPVPQVSNLNVVAGQTVANAVVVRVGQDGAVRLRNAQGSVHLVVDLAGWWAPTGDGWDISWPQCTAAGSTTSRLPNGGAFAVVGLTRRVPFTDNECFAAQWAWASTLPGEPSVYLNINAPGPRDTPDGRVWAELCGTGAATTACAQAYGVRAAQYVLPRLRATPSGGKPMLWMDVEGPYTNGPFWQSGEGGVARNRAVLNGAVDTLRGAGYRVGIYSDRGTSTNNDWTNIMGDYQLLQTQNWVFTSPQPDGAFLCTPANSFSGGPVVMAQVQPAVSGQAYDVNHLC